MGSRWQVEKKNDPYYKRAKSEEYRSRASYKLKQLDKKYKRLKFEQEEFISKKKIKEIIKLSKYLNINI